MSDGNHISIMIVAGEASGDMHGANLVKKMLEIDPSLHFYGIGGKRMKEAGVELLANSADMAVVGLTEVFSRLVTITKAMNQLKGSIKKNRPKLAILIDYPDFNLSLAKTVKSSGIKVFYYISPQIWAWRKGRIKLIKKNVDKMVVVLPFEAELYHQANIDATFVGHPLLDEAKPKYSKEKAFRRFGLEAGVKTIGILPGSRPPEIERLLPEMLKAADIIRKRLSPVQFIMPLAETLNIDLVSNIIKKHSIPINIAIDSIYDVLQCTEAAIVASGTATLETALMETPLVIVYKVSSLSYHAGKLLINIDHIGLANIIAGKTIVPELIQDKANAENIAAEIIDIMTNETKMETMKKDLKAIRNQLGEPGAAARAAQIAYKMLEIDSR